jgi:PAS domain S-box-containing protein
MALPHLLIGLKGRAWESLFFAVAALAVAGIAAGELGIMHSTTVDGIGRAQQWVHIPVFFLYFGMIGFVTFYFGTGRIWLGLTAVGLRLVTLVINFAFPPNLNFREITGLRHLSFLGDTVAMPQGVVSSWTQLGLASSLVALAFVFDASLALWRRGGADARRRAIVVGGSITFFIIVGAGLSALIHPDLVHLPYIISFPFLAVIFAMGFELSHDVMRAAQLARELGEEERRLELATSAGGLGLWRWDVANDQVWMNEKGRSLFGFGPQDKPNAERFRSRLHPEDREAVHAIAANALPLGTDYQAEYRVVLPDQTIRWLHSRGRVELGPDGKPRHVHGVSFDITERKSSEGALQESEMRFRTVADVAPVIIWMSGREKEGVFFNKGWLEFTGRTLDQEVGAGWLEGIHPDDLAHCLHACGTAFNNRVPFTVEFRLRRKDGEYRWLLDTGAPRFEADGTFAGYIGSCIDITERRQSELDHQLQSTELARVGRLAVMGELAASLAHEVNNPLGAMVANASAGQRLLSQGQLQPDQLREFLADIVADGQRAREVIQGIRNMVRKGEASLGLVDVKDLIGDSLRMVRADAIARKVALVVEVDPNAGLVMGDRVQLLQVLLNLTMNAFEAVTVMRPEARRVIVQAECVEDGTVCVKVRDTGPGFPEGLAEQLFEPFFSTKPEGTGMGLAIARSIVEAHGGTLAAKNCQGSVGAIFTICLPEAAAAKSRAA